MAKERTRRLEDGKPVGIKRIAELAGTSASTVSRVLSGRAGSVKISRTTQERIKALCRQLDYQPSIHASRLFRKQSRVIGFLADTWSLHQDENLAKSMFSACRALWARGYRCLPLINDDAFVRQKEHLALFRRKEIDGLFVWGAREEHGYLAELRDAGNPFVLLTNPVEEYPSVYPEQRDPMRTLATACLERGARRIAAVVGISGESYRQRRLGIEDALDGRNLSVFEISDPATDLPAMLERISAVRPEAVLCANDEAAVLVERGLLSRGVRIPGDVVVAGGDNIQMSAYCQVPLTTFDQMAGRCAERGVEILLDHLTDGKPLRSEKIDAPVIWRESLPGIPVPKPPPRKERSGQSLSRT